MTLSYKLIDEIEFVKLLNQGDEGAFNEIFNRYHSKLYSHCYNNSSLNFTIKD
jgi:predicted alpha-1,6-mannanase (GH76 family)